MSSGGIFDIAGKLKRAAELDEQSAAPGFWEKREAAQTVLREQKLIKGTVDSWTKQSRALDDAMVLAELAEEAGDDASAREAESQGRAVETALADMEWRRMLSGESDAMGAIVSINAGAGGVDAADWAQMIMRMLLRYSERRGWKTDILDEQPAEEAGIKSAMIAIEGEYAYGLL